MRRPLLRLASAAYRRVPPGVRQAMVAARGFPQPLLIERPPGHRVVVLAPHPDDELIGCGGTLAKHLDGGDEVWLVFVTSGEATSGLRPLPPDQRGPRREGEARRAMTTLGVTEDRLRFLRAPDFGVGTDTGLPTRLATVLEEANAELVYAPWPIDANRDHRATAEILGRRLQESTKASPLVALYEVWTPLSPTHLVDVTDLLPRKLEALACYESALATIDYRHSAAGLAAYRSSQGLAGQGYAEVFCTLDATAFVKLLAALA